MSIYATTFQRVKSPSGGFESKYFEDVFNSTDIQRSKHRRQLVDQIGFEGVGIEQSRDDVISHDLA